MNSTDSIRFVKGVGPKKVDLLAKLGIKTIRDALYYRPRDWQFIPDSVCIDDVMADNKTKYLVHGFVEKSKVRIGTGGRKYKTSLLTDKNGDSVPLAFFNHDWAILPRGDAYVYGAVTSYRGKRQMVNPVVYQADGDLSDISGSVYPATEGMPSKAIKRIIRKCLQSVVVSDVLPLDMVGMTEMDALRRLHFPVDSTDVKMAMTHFKTKELMVMQLAIGKRRESRRRLCTAKRCFNQSVVSLARKMGVEFTPSQFRAMGSISSDMHSLEPMNRLITGDVGSGKTAVAFHAMITAANSVYGQAMMVLPTSVLAHQHYRELCMLVGFDKVALVVGGFPRLEGTAKKIRTGEAQYIIGTTAVQFAKFEYKDLRLVVFDEQHRFGVHQRKIQGQTPHVLTMTATPIPRTIMVGVLGDMDQSHLEPWVAPERETTWTDDLTILIGELDACRERGELAYLVCSNINDLEMWYDYLRADDYGMRVGMAHGQMAGRECEQAIDHFKNGLYDVLCCTTVIEVGVHVPEATLMIITDPDRFGLAQLHQLRGRVGRSGKKGYCSLYTSPDDISDTAMQRVISFCCTNDGQSIAELDLKLRGPGAIFGDNQHGLPDLEYVDLVSDFALLKHCKVMADTMLDNDPQLMDPEHLGLSALMSAKVVDEQNFFAT